MEDDTHRYDDIINMPYQKSKKHPHMSLYDRAAQFSPFAALTGHDDAIKETERLTDMRADTDEYFDMRINEKLIMIRNNNDVYVKITYFVPDSIKDGGEYVTVSGMVKKIDEYKKAVIMKDKTIIPIDAITDIDSEIFNDFYI